MTPAGPSSASPVDSQQPVAWRLEHFIDGCFVAGAGANLAPENPATGEVLAGLPQVSNEQLDSAVAAARRAFESGIWRDGSRRRSVLSRMADLFEKRKDDLLRCVISEIGTPIAIARFLQIEGPLAMLRDVAARADVDRTERLASDARPPASESVIRYEPIGVVAGIGAYNNPLLYLISKCCAALTAGCTAVYLPSSLTPLTALLFGEIVAEAGVPPGVLNIVAGSADIARTLAMHPGVDKVSMTGSVEVGRRVMRQAADGLKGVVLELGGKSPGIVLPGADIERISLPLHGRYLRNAGQGCQSPTRLLVHASQYDDFVDAARVAFTRLPIGDPWNPSTLIGPLIRESHRARIEAFVDRALANGGTVLAGGGRPDLDRGWFMNGALLGGLSNHSEIARSELFGPVAILIAYEDLDAAIAIANDTDFGLAAHLFGPQDAAMDAAKRLRVGTVAINGGGNFRVDSVLGGWKQSGIGREWGEHGIREFLELQHIQWTT
jgi:aldehyde dehydrogenase (NAD+)/betaine-aldehyde dehydrogenase